MRLAAVFLPLAMALPAMANPTDKEPQPDPSAPARSPSLLDGACSFTTSVVASRVLDEGESWSYTGTLQRTQTPPGTHVSAPYTVGPSGDVHIVATELLDSLVSDELDTQRLDLQGKRLEVGNIDYFVLTNVAASSATQ